MWYQVCVFYENEDKDGNKIFDIATWYYKTTDELEVLIESSKLKDILDNIKKYFDFFHVTVTSLPVNILANLTQNNILVPPDCSTIIEIK